MAQQTIPTQAQPPQFINQALSQQKQAAPQAQNPQSTPAPTQAQNPQPAQTPTPAQAQAPQTAQDAPKQKSAEELYLESLTDADRALYLEIKNKLIEENKIIRLLVSGSLTYTYQLKGMPIEFRILDGKQKYIIDQYQYGEDPLGIYAEEFEAGIKYRMENYGEDRAQAFQNYLERQSIDQVAKRSILVTLGMSIATFNSRQLGEITKAVKTIESFQIPLIQKLHQVYSLFESAVTNILNDEEFLKN